MSSAEWMSWLKTRHYEKAPIKEAIIHIQTEPPSSGALAKFENSRILSQGYVERRKLVRGELRGQMEGDQLKATATQDDQGFAFVGGLGKHVAQFRLDGFFFSRLAPYQTWEQLRNEAQSLWQVYRDVVGPLPVVRVGLRYVNQLDIPLPVRDFRDFIRSYPEISSDLPQQLEGFFMQIRIPQPDIKAMLILNEALVPPPDDRSVSIVLDIDVFRQGLKMETDDDLWNTLEELRMRKNLVFEGCITNNTRELIS